MRYKYYLELSEDRCQTWQPFAMFSSLNSAMTCKNVFHVPEPSGRFIRCRRSDGKIYA